MMLSELIENEKVINQQLNQISHGQTSLIPKSHCYSANKILCA